MAKDILKEAIADAKAVREVALANAKAALEEAFTPKLQSMLSAKLSEDLTEEYDEDEKNMKEYYDEDEKGKMDEMMYDEDEADEDMKEMSYGEDEKDEDMKESDLDEEIDLEEILNELELEESEEVSEDTVDEGKDEADEDMKEGSQDSGPFRGTVAGKPKKIKTKADTYAGNAAKEGKDADEDMKEGKDEADEDMKEGKKKEELDEMGRPIYKAEDANYAGYTADRIHEEQDFDLDALLEEINNLDEKKDEADEDMKESYMEESEAINEVDPLTVAAGITGLIAAAGGLTKIEMAADDPDFKRKYPKVAKALEKLQSIGKAAADAKRMQEETMAEELEETKAALEAVKTELNEVNLLNSKLLYVNRIFKANNLTEAQKLRVVETLDNAENVKEAKLIYETIKDTFVISKDKKTTPKRSIKEGLGMASKAAGTSTAAKKPVLNESNDMVTRMQKLANIKISQ